MIIQKIFENEELILDDDSIKIAQKVKEQNPMLPFNILENRIIFDNYTVGTIQIHNTIINILPRNKVFNLDTIFQMILFNNDIPFNTQSTVGYDYENVVGSWIVPNTFLKMCKKLFDFGLTGGYKIINETSYIIKGELNLRNYNNKQMRINGINYNKQEYTLNIKENQIIKAALNKIKRNSNSYQKEITNMLRELDEVDNFVGNIYEYDMRNYSFFSSNPYYPEVITIALTILKDMFIAYENGSIEWYSFLQNSNSLFESYVRKLISKAIILNVQKWNEPKEYASIQYNSKIGFKYYIPDIVIGYDKNTNKSKIVLDAKNKIFNPEGNLSELVSSNDMYQILFYCRKLKTNLGGLIYPTDKNYNPIIINVNDEMDLKIVLMSINMRTNVKEQIQKIKKDITENLLKNI